MTYEEFVKEYPCEWRNGMGFSGCQCNNNWKQDDNYVDCKAYASKSYPRQNCVNCPYRLANLHKYK